MKPARKDGTGRSSNWLNAQPATSCVTLLRADARSRRPLPTCPDIKAAQVLCFVIHPQWRRRGVARALLLAVRAAGAAGFESIEAYPFNAGDSEDATDHYHGTLSMFIDAGFEIIREDSSLSVVRKTLTPR